MARKPGNFRKVRLVFGRKHPVLKTALAALITLATVSMVTLGLGYREAEERIERLRQQAVELEQENDRLNDRIEALGTVESIRQIAAEELGLVDPNTIIMESDTDSQ